MKKTVLLLVVLLSTQVVGQSGGGTVFPFLTAYHSGLGVALGQGAVAYNARTSELAFENPLLLNDSLMGQVAMGGGLLAEGIHLIQGSYTFESKRGQRFITGFKTVQYGAFESTDIWGNSLGTFYASDYSIQLGAQQDLGKHWKLGVNAKVVNGTYETYQSWAVASDVYLGREVSKGRFFMVHAQNIGTQLTAFHNVREPMPFDLALSLNGKLEHAPFHWALVVDQLHKPNLAYNDPNLVSIDPITGEETVEAQSLLNLTLRHISGSLAMELTNRVHLFSGFSFRKQYETALPQRRTSGGFSFGVGIYFKRLQIHYGNDMRSVSGRMNTLSLTLPLN